jgi:hypothetical protein
VGWCERLMMCRFYTCRYRPLRPINRFSAILTVLTLLDVLLASGSEDWPPPVRRGVDDDAPFPDPTAVSPERWRQ